MRNGDVAFAMKPVNNSSFHATAEKVHSKKVAVRKANWILFLDPTGKHEPSSVYQSYNDQSINEEFNLLNPKLQDGILNCFGLMPFQPSWSWDLAKHFRVQQCSVELGI